MWMLDGSFDKYMKAEYFTMHLDRQLSTNLNGCFLFESDKYMAIVIKIAFETFKEVEKAIYRFKIGIIRGKSHV